MSKIKISFLFILFSLVIFSCKKKDEEPEPEPKVPVVNNPTPKEPALFLKAQIDTMDIDYSIITGLEPLNASSSSDASIGSGGMASTFKYGTSISSLAEERAIYITIGTLYLPDGGRPYTEEFFDFFQIGTYNYSNEADDGIEIVFLDENGTIWTSNGDQTGSSFEISKTTNNSFWGTEYVEFLATFNCTLYDESGNSMLLTNGSCKSSFENI